MKSATAGMISHLAQEVTTLALCLKVVRKDGQSFHFTSLDDDLVIDGDTYRSAIGISRTAVESSSTLDVDNVDVQGIIDDDAITVSDIETGRYDDAVADLFLVNWKDLTQGKVRIRYGWLGEMRREKLYYQADITGLVKALLKSINELYTLRCPAELGDARCKVVMEPAPWAADAPHAAKDAVESTYSERAALVLVNPDAEANSTTGWTQEMGAFGIRSATPAPFQGAHYFFGGTSAHSKQYQDSSLPAAWIAATDAGDVTVTLTWQQASFAASNDEGFMEVECRDAGSNVLATFSASGSSPGQTWTARSASGAVPATTRSFRVRMDALRLSGTSNDAYFDSVDATLTSASPVSGAFDGRRYVATVAGTSGGTEPAWDATVGNTTADGGVTWVARNAFRKYAAVTYVESSRIFGIGGMLDVADGDFDLGLATFTSGLNAGVSREVATFLLGRVTLFEDAPFTVAAGDAVTLFRGCDKKPETCVAVFDNKINYRGFDRVPGQDSALAVASE